MKRVAFLLSPGHQVMTFALISVFEFANRAAGEAHYEIRLLSETGGLVASSIGTLMHTAPFDETDHDTVIVGGGPEVAAGRLSPAFIAFLHRSAKTARRIAGPCTGAFALGDAGLLDGRRATTHWGHARNLQARFPKAMVEEDRIHIADGPIWTSAGMTAGIDLALAMVEGDLGAELARIVARQLVVYHRRAGGQSQFSTLLELEPKSDRIQMALDYAKKNLGKILGVDDLAEVAHLSPRQFSRAFRAETRESPAKAIERLRVEAARQMIQDGRLTVDEIARDVGLVDRNRMRRAFLRILGQPPQAIRRNARLELIA